MPVQVSVLIGPSRSGKTFRLLGEYRQALRARPGSADSRTLWLAPTVRNARVTRRALLAEGLAACLQPGVMTFEELAGRILAASTCRQQLLSACQQRAVLRQVVHAALENKRLAYLARVAVRSAFIDLLAEHIRELKRRGIGPDDFLPAANPRHDRDQQAELHHLYAEYEAQLKAHGLCDFEGLYGPACEALAASARPWPGQLDLIVADGFTDFTQVQLALLRSLADQAGRLMIALPGDVDAAPAAGRDDLFAKSEATLVELKRLYPRLTVERLPPRPSDWPALDHLAGHLFRNPRHVPPLPHAAQPSLDRLAILAGAGVHDEIALLAREIKRRLLQGEARPGEVVVAFRSLQDAAPRVREVFTEYGIPHLVETAIPLLASGTIRTLLGLLRLVDDDWPFRRVVSVVTNNALTALDGQGRAATDWLVRELQIAQGRRTLWERVEPLAADAAALPAGHPAKRRLDAAAAALPLLRQLAAALDELPDRATPTDWGRALAQLGTQLGLAPFAQPVDEANQPGAVDDRLAWQRVVEHLASLDRLAAWQNQSPPQLSRSDFLGLLIDVATHEKVPQPFDEVGRVRVLSAATARTVSAKHLFLAGMSEQAFPSPERVGRFYSEDDYRAFAAPTGRKQAGKSPAPVRRSQEEMLLFYEVLTRATGRLTISYPALDDKAQALPPSPYVTEIERTLGPEVAARRVEPVLSPIPAEQVPLCPADWRVQAVADALRGESRLLAGLLTDERSQPLAHSLEAALRTIHARSRGHSFGPYEGMLTSPAARARLAQRFGPQHLWSPSQFEEYAACPYQFFLKNVLGLEPLGELTLETDYARRGTFLHEVLAELHREQRNAAAAAKSTTSFDRSSFLDAFGAAVETVRRSMPRLGVEAALVEIDRRQIDQWAESYFEDLAKYDGNWSELAAGLAPSHFEVRFGPPRPGETHTNDPQSNDRPLELDIGGEQIKITGRIDRIDVGRAGERLVFNVIDYKSGRRPTLTRDKIESGERLQPALYVMAAQAVLFADENATPLWSGYWSMKNGLTMKANTSLHCSADGASPTDEWEALQPIIAERIGQFVRGIRQGEFPVVSRDDQCTSRCEYNTACRIAQVRNLGKTWPPISAP
jgi:ATP-dependent helicase/DNAse subunit B